jgi:hypothetical protein
MLALAAKNDPFNLAFCDQIVAFRAIACCKWIGLQRGLARFTRDIAARAFIENMQKRVILMDPCMLASYLVVIASAWKIYSSCWLPYS